MDVGFFFFSRGRKYLFPYTSFQYHTALFWAIGGRISLSLYVRYSRGYISSNKMRKTYWKAAKPHWKKSQLHVFLTLSIIHREQHVEIGRLILDALILRPDLSTLSFKENKLADTSLHHQLQLHIARCTVKRRHDKLYEDP
jgi:hypothetical protein